MKRDTRWKVALLGLVLLQLLPGGCGTGKNSRFYTLNPVAATGPAPPVQSSRSSGPLASIGILPVEIPDYLDRPQIVTRNPTNGLELGEFDRWGGELQKDIARVLAETMSARLPGNGVFVLTGRRAVPADFWITVHVTRFDPIPGDVVRLKAVWTVLKKDGLQVVVRGESNLSEPILGRDYGATVAAMSLAVDHLGNEIADAVKPRLIALSASGSG